MKIPEEIIDGVRELITIGVGRSAGMLNRQTRNHVVLSVPEVSIACTATAEPMHPVVPSFDKEDTSRVVLDFTGEMTGSISLVIPHTSALNLAIILSEEGGTPDEMDALRIETLLEVSNIITSSIMSAMSILIVSRLSFQFPYYQNECNDCECQMMKSPFECAISAKIKFEVLQKQIEGLIIINLNQESFDHLSARIHAIMEKGL